MNDFDGIWSQASLLLKQQLNQDIYNRWIAVISVISFHDNVLTLSVGNDFYRSWLEDNYLKLIKDAVDKVTDLSVEIQFEVKPSDVEPVASGFVMESLPAKKSVETKKSFSTENEIRLDPKYCFDSFVVGPCNEFAHASSLAVARAPGTAYNPLFVYGGTSLGKTHLMQAIGQYIAQNIKQRVCYVSCETLMNEYIESIQKKSFNEFRRKYRTADVLLIDDIQFLANKTALQEEFFHTFNILYNARKQIVMTSDRNVRDIAGLEERLVSRFEWGLISELTPPDFETRVAILKSKQARQNLQISNDIITFIATNIRSNIRRLEGALTKVTTYSSLYNKPVTMDLVAKLLEGYVEQEKYEPVSISNIQKAVAGYFDVRVADLMGKNRSQGITVPRQIAMYISRQLTKASLPEIGASFGKTHATVLHACRLIERKMGTDAQMKVSVQKISRQVCPTHAS